MKKEYVVARTLILAVCLAFLVSSCAFLKQPRGKIVTEIVAQDVGYLIARENPELASALLKYTEWVMEAGNLDFDKWGSVIVGVLVNDELLRMSFKKLLSLVEADLGGVEDIEERLVVIIPILRCFAEGIRACLK
jgi:hypothetical protein